MACLAEPLTQTDNTGKRINDIKGRTLYALSCRPFLLICCLAVLALGTKGHRLFSNEKATIILSPKSITAARRAGLCAPFSIFSPFFPFSPFSPFSRSFNRSKGLIFFVSSRFCEGGKGGWGLQRMVTHILNLLALNNRLLTTKLIFYLKIHKQMTEGWQVLKPKRLFLTPSQEGFGPLCLPLSVKIFF